MINKKTIILNGVSKSFVQDGTVIPVLKNISYTFEQDKTYAITGISGSGKSTLLHLIAGLDIPSEGSVVYNNKNLALLPSTQKDHYLNKEIGLIFQLPYLLDELTVFENVTIKGIVGGLDTAEYSSRAAVLLQELGIASKASCFTRSLSGGQQQRVALARALLTRPSFLFADEPTGNLDEKTGNTIIDILIHYYKVYGMGLLVSSHDPYVIEKMDTVVALKDGQLTEL